MSRDQPVRLVLLGAVHVGKSSLALQFAKGNFSEFQETTIGAAFLTRKIPIDADTSFKVEIWDTAGQERYHSLAPMYYRGAQAAIIVYDITDSETLRRAKMWVRELREANGSEMVIGLAGNKLDLAVGNRRQVNAREVADYADENNLTFAETSAKRAENVEEIFLNVARQAVSKQTRTKSNVTLNGVELNKKSNSSNARCCSSGKRDATKP